MLTKKRIREMLPKLGEKRMESPTVDETQGIHMTKEPRECVVVYVNRAHCWYTVQFEDGTRESYRIPTGTPVRGVDYV